MSEHSRSDDDTIKADVEADNLFELFAPIRGLLMDEEIDHYFRRNPSLGRPIDLE